MKSSRSLRKVRVVGCKLFQEPQTKRQRVRINADIKKYDRCNRVNYPVKPKRDRPRAPFKVTSFIRENERELFNNDDLRGEWYAEYSSYDSDSDYYIYDNDCYRSFDSEDDY